jgi:Killing trait
MADETKQDAPGAESAEAPAASGGSTINSQVTDAIAALNTLTEGLGPSTSAAMLGVMGADSIALAMLNAVARQQADATIGSAALAAVCARLAGTRLPEGAGAAASPAQFVAGAEAQAQAAILLLKSQAEQDGDAGEAAKAALERVAAAAAPTRAGKAGKSGGAA